MTNQKIKISLGTRAYNAEKTIEQTIKSVLSQTLSDFEYFIMDNGSTDDTRKILQKYAQKDNRVHVLHLDKNNPEFSTMHMLVEKGKGEFFALLDSDDWLENHFFEKLYKGARKSGVEIAVAGSCFHFVDQKKIGYRKANWEGTVPKEEYGRQFMYLYQFFRPVWGKIFSTELVKKYWNDISVERPKKLSYGGDTYTSFALLKKSTGFFITKSVLHNYRVHQSSSYRYMPNQFFSDCFLYDYVKKFLENEGFNDDQNEKFLLIVYRSAVLDTLRNLFGSKIELNKKWSNLIEIFSNPYVKKAFTDFHDLDTQKVWVDILKKMNGQGGDIEKDRSMIEAYHFFAKLEPIIEQSIVDVRFLKEHEQIVVESVLSPSVQGLVKLTKNLFEDDRKDQNFYEDRLLLSIKLSALLNQPHIFVEAYKALAWHKLFCKNQKEAVYYIQELMEMLPEDKSVQALKDSYDSLFM